MQTTTIYKLSTNLYGFIGHAKLLGGSFVSFLFLRIPKEHDTRKEVDKGNDDSKIEAIAESVDIE